MPKQEEELFPWHSADASRKIGINVPMPEPLMKKLDYLIEHKAIRSKSSFIRDAVEQAASDEIARLWRVQEAVRAYEKQGRRKR